uniref:Cytochrome P450 n=1 Tax=Meloidogyne javanica TaxID=6303 RepID=A0A915LWT0_MELJA
YKAMRDYGIDKDTVEKQVLDAIFRVIDKIKNEKEMGKSEHSIDREVDLMTGSIINQIMLGFSFYGERFKEFSGLKQLLDIQQVYFINQNSQEKLQNELDKVMEEKRRLAEETGEEFDGKFRQSDRTKLSYTNAVVNETQRLSNLLPLNLTRVANKDVKIGGHNLKAGTVVIPQISTVLFDEGIFPDPEKFIPERFLDENGQFKKIEENIPFGVGKSCVGEALARMELFLFTANFFYKFHV